MMAQEKTHYVPIGIGLIFLPVLIVEFVFKFVRSKVQFYLKNDQIYKKHPASCSCRVGIIHSPYCTKNPNKIQI